MERQVVTMQAVTTDDPPRWDQLEKDFAIQSFVQTLNFKQHKVLPTQKKKKNVQQQQKKGHRTILIIGTTANNCL